MSFKIATAFSGLLAACALMGCSPQADAQAGAAPAVQSADRSEGAGTTHAESGLRVIPLTVTSGGKAHSFKVEVAASQEEQAKGLMFRTELGDFEGMIFPYEAPQVLSFWMRNTPLPLDIIFIGPDSRVLTIHAKTTPYTLESYTSDGPAIAALELRGGRAEELGIELSDLVQWDK